MIHSDMSYIAPAIRRVTLERLQFRARAEVTKALVERAEIELIDRGSHALIDLALTVAGNRGEQDIVSPATWLDAVKQAFYPRLIRRWRWLGHKIEHRWPIATVTFTLHAEQLFPELNLPDNCGREVILYEFADCCLAGPIKAPNGPTDSQRIATLRRTLKEAREALKEQPWVCARLEEALRRTA